MSLQPVQGWGAAGCGWLAGAGVVGGGVPLKAGLLRTNWDGKEGLTV